MTDNEKSSTTAADSETGAAEARRPTRRRIVGTPTAGDSAFADTTGEGELRQDEGAYPPEETHVRTEEERRAGEKLAAAWFLIAALAGVGFLVSYFLWSAEEIGDPQLGQYSNMALGGTLALAMFAIGAGMTVWVRRIIPHYDVASPYEEMPSAAEEKGSFGDFFMRGANESGFTRSPILRRTLILSMIPLGIAPVVMLRDLGPLPGEELRTTAWTDGVHMVVEGTGRRLRAEDLDEVGGMISVLPENEEDPEHPVGLDEQAKSVTLLIKMPLEDFSPNMSEQQLSWTHDGIIAYSKVCTHVGCPAALYERTTHRILCPCHQSTFDAADGAKVVFGPAARPLPQLPVRVDAEGYLVAAGDFSSPPGPTFWDAEREAYLREQGED